MIVRELLAKLGLAVDGASFKKGDEALGKTTGGLKKLGAAAGAALAAVGLGLSKFVNSQVEAIDAIGKTSTQLGVSTEALQELAFAADLAGVDFNQFSTGLAFLQKNAKEAADGMASFKDEFSALGINVKDANGQLKDGPQLLEELADGLQGVESSSQRVGIAQTLMGRTGRKLLPLLKDGAVGVRALREEAQTLGFVLGEEDVRATEFLKDEMTRFERVTRGLKQQIFLGLLPTVTNLFTALQTLGKQFTQWLRGTKLVEAGLKLLAAASIAAGIAFVIAFAGPLLAVAKVLAIVALLTLAIEDVLTLFDGGRSVVGTFIDEIFGLGTASEFVENFREGVRQMGEAWEEAGGEVVGFFANLLGFQTDIQNIAEAMDNLGATVFEFLDRARIGIQNLLDSGVSKIVKFIAEVTGQTAVASAVEQQLQERVSARELAQARTTRGLGGRRIATGLAGGALERREGMRERLAARQERRRTQRLAREAGVEVEGVTFQRGRALDRGVGSDTELTRFGVARAATAERVRAIELNQDNRNVINIDGTGGDPEAIRRRVEQALAERDERNRREANAAVSRTASGG